MKRKDKPRALTPEDAADVEITDQEPMFESLDEACEMLGWSDEFKARVALGMELTRPRGPDDVVH